MTRNSRQLLQYVRFYTVLSPEKRNNATLIKTVKSVPYNDCATNTERKLLLTPTVCSMGGPLKCYVKEGGGRIIRSLYNRDVVSAHSNA